MSRSGFVDYDDCCDDYPDLTAGRWRGMVLSATRGKRGQAFFRDLLAALDALPEKKLITHELERQDGCVCTLGALGKARGLPMKYLDPEDWDRVAAAFDIATPLEREVVFVNDEAGPLGETPEQRFTRVRNWVSSQIKPDPESA